MHGGGARSEDSGRPCRTTYLERKQPAGLADGDNGAREKLRGSRHLGAAGLG